MARARCTRRRSGSRGGVVDRRAAPADAGTDRLLQRHQAGGLGALTGVPGAPRAGRPRPDEVDVAGGVGGRHQQPQLEVGVEEADLADAGRTPRGGARPGSARRPGSTRSGSRRRSVGQLGGEVEQGERVAPGGGRRSGQRAPGRWAPAGRRRRSTDRGVGSSPRPGTRRTGRRASWSGAWARLAAREQQCRGLGLEPAGDEGQRLQGLARRAGGRRRRARRAVSSSPAAATRASTPIPTRNRSGGGPGGGARGRAAAPAGALRERGQVVGRGIRSRWIAAYGIVDSAS